MMRRRGKARRYGRAVHPPMPDMSWLYGGAGGTMHERAAKALGWSVADTQSMSLAALREMVRPVNPELAGEMTRAIQSGSHIVGAPQKKRRRR